MNRLPLFFFAGLIGFYILYLIFFTPMIDNLLTRFRTSKKADSVKEFADEIDLASDAYQRVLERRKREMADAMAELETLPTKSPLGNPPKENAPTPHTPEQNQP